MGPSASPRRKWRYIGNHGPCLRAVRTIGLASPRRLGPNGFMNRPLPTCPTLTDFESALRRSAQNHWFCEVLCGDPLQNHWFCEAPFGARSAAGSMTAVSLTRSMREHGFQMHHYRDCAGDPLMRWRCEPLSFAYFSLRQAKKSRCPPRTGATLINQYQFKERPKNQTKERPNRMPTAE
jgi:hypothetical protein